MDVRLALSHLLPQPKCGGSLTDNSRESYDALVWEDERPKPTWAEIEAAWRELESKLLVEHAAKARWRKETGGTTWNGYPVHTDRDSQSKLSAAYALARDGFWTDGSGWKFADGVFRPLTALEVQNLALAVSAFVQSCFAAEAQVLADIASGAITTKEQIDAALA